MGPILAHYIHTYNVRGDDYLSDLVFDFCPHDTHPVWTRRRTGPLGTCKRSDYHWPLRIFIPIASPEKANRTDCFKLHGCSGCSLRCDFDLRTDTAIYGIEF